MKKIIKNVFIAFVFVILFANNIYAATDNNFTKRIVSVVYDDSWSMFNNGQDYAYANYALQNIIGFMNENDELHIVKMSDKTVYDTINISNKSKKEQQIKDIAMWNTGADETPFEAIETAVDCLKECKDKYGSSDNIEYWLLVLTDGGFEGMPADVKGYLENVQSYMSDVKFESIYVFIGGQAFSTVKSVAEHMQNTTCITSSNNEDICRGLFEAAEKIYGRTSLKDTDFQKNADEVKLTFPFPINKLIIYEQDQDIALKDVKTSKGDILTSDIAYVANKFNAPALTSKIIEVKGNGDCIPSGDVVLTFDGDVDLSESKFQVMVDSAVSLDIKVVDVNGVEISSDRLNTFTKEDVLNFVVTPINSYDHTTINMTDYVSKSEANYQYENKKTKLQYDTRDLNYKFNSPIHTGNNNFVADLNLKGYFNVFSNSLNIYVSPEPIALQPKISPDAVNIGNSFTKDYEKAGLLTYEMQNMKSKVNASLEFSNIPKGIQIKVNGNTVKKNKVSLTLNEKNDIEVYRNKDYKETESQNISINVALADKSINIKDKGVHFALKPVIRTLKLDTKELFDDINKFTTANAYGKNLYEQEVLVDGKNISKEELKQSKIAFENNGDTVGFKYKIKEDQNKNTIHLFIKRPLISIGDKNVDTTFTITTPYNEILTYRMAFNIKWNLLDTIIRLLVPLLLIVYIIGLIKKPRFEKKNHKIIVMENGKEIYNGPLTIYGGFGNLIPYVPQKGKAYDLNIMAADTKKAIIVCKNSLKDGMRYDNEEISLKKDLKVYEDVFLEYSEGRNHNTRYMYSDVVTGQVNDAIKSTRRGRR